MKENAIVRRLMLKTPRLVSERWIYESHKVRKGDSINKHFCSASEHSDKETQKDSD
jgi:hypothetical protein